MLHWKCGFEIELLAPEGKSRKDIARQIAKKNGGRIERIFYPQSEPSAVEGMEVFHNLVLGYKVFDKGGNPVVTCVDDLTITRDLDNQKASRKGWYRIISDDTRILRLVMRHCDSKADQRDVLVPLAKLFGTELDMSQKEMFKVADETSAPVAIASSLPGERERPCELITPPLKQGQSEYLENLMAVAAELGFYVPVEAAVHIHFDAERLQNTQVFCKLVRLFDRFTDDLKKLVGSNPNCIRLGYYPDELVALVNSERFQALPWKQAKPELRDLKLSKYCDFNVLNLVNGTANKNTFEVRILPGSMDAGQMISQAVLFQQILDYCIKTKDDAALPENLKDLLSAIELPENEKKVWLSRL